MEMDDSMMKVSSGDAKETYSTEDGIVTIDRAKEKKLVRKLDLHIVPVVMLLYLLSFLDR